MSHPFEVGKTYRNRAGEYAVVSIEGDQMKIRYVDGRVLDTAVDIQARIWENIQFEEQMARAEERQRLAREARQAVRMRTRRARTKPQFGGFQTADFEPKERGIAWTTRKEFGRVLAYELTQRTAGVFSHWIVPRESRVHVARIDQYDKDQRDRNAAFFAAASETGLSIGFRVSKPSGETEDTWPWSRFVEALSTDGELRRVVHGIMEGQPAVLDVYAMQVRFGRVGRATVHEDGFEWQRETAGQEETRSLDWDGLVELLGTLTSESRSVLYFRTVFSPEEAVEAGGNLAQQVADHLERMAPLYDAAVGAGGK